MSKGDDLPTELCVGSDGRIYVNAEGVDPEKIKGRKMFRGFAMTADEQKVATEEAHRLAFNVTVSVQEEMRQRRLQRKLAADSGTNNHPARKGSARSTKKRR